MPELLRQGKLDRSARVLQQAAQSCPQEALAARLELLPILTALGRHREASALIAALERKRQQSQAAGRTALAQELSRAVKQGRLALSEAVPTADDLIQRAQQARAEGKAAQAQRLFDTARWVLVEESHGEGDPWFDVRASGVWPGGGDWLTFAQGGESLAVAAHDRFVVSLVPPSGAVRWRRDLGERYVSYYQSDIGTTPDGRALVTVLGDAAMGKPGRVGFLDPDSGRTQHELSFGATVLTVKPSPTNCALAVALSRQKPVSKWVDLVDCRDGHTQQSFPGAAPPIAFSPDGRYLVTGYQAKDAHSRVPVFNTVKLWQLPKALPLVTAPLWVDGQPA